MLLLAIVRASTAVAATPSRLAKRAILADVLRLAEPEEIDLVATYLAGSLRQRRTGVGWASLAALPDPAPQPTLEVRDVDARLERIAAESGAGSSARRDAALTDLLEAATSAEQQYLRALVLGDVRQGASASLVQDALAAAFEVPLALVRRAAMLAGSTASAARAVAAGGQAALEAIGLTVGVPVEPMLAAAAPNPSDAVAKSGLPAFVDAKLDGIRVQVHRWPGDGTTGAAGADEVRLFTRSLDDITDRLPEVVAQARALPESTFVLDGEVIALRPDGRPVPFQLIAARTATTDAEAAAGLPVALFAFDVLHVAGRDLLDEPLHVRAEALAALVPPELTVPREVVTTAERAAEVFARAVGVGWEGVVVKRRDAPYAAGRRDSAWVKVKPRHTFDLAVVGAEWGYGRRTGWLSNLHLAARDGAGNLVMLGKTFKGLTDAMLTWQTAELLARESRRTASTVFVDPPLVAEIAIDGVQVSTRYPGGVALRFARVLRYRDDKTVADVDLLADVAALSPVIDGS
ncbi:ATP-dependent DNA ligase [Miniimonas arenae]|uniref:DNA ligase n=1 Tax=Miniimonas arenae TaxID=676201 RepID=A0A5C5B8L0_9MICO|nr:ATP-dependent DNA ligase [Miniimonas arenae]TNU73200.1 ATP-dependent DNA ligase [Miniimonas arenae]